MLSLLSPDQRNFVLVLGWDVAYLNPFAQERGFELKVQLARAAIEAIEAIWSVIPQARIVQPEPVINIIPSHNGLWDYPNEVGEREIYWPLADKLRRQQ